MTLQILKYFYISCYTRSHSKSFVFSIWLLTVSLNADSSSGSWLFLPSVCKDVWKEPSGPLLNVCCAFFKCHWLKSNAKLIWRSVVGYLSETLYKYTVIKYLQIIYKLLVIVYLNCILYIVNTLCTNIEFSNTLF